MPLSSATPFEPSFFYFPSLLHPPLVFYSTLAPPFFVLEREVWEYRRGRARGRNSFRRNEVMKSDPTSLTGLIGLIWRSLYVDKLRGCVHRDAHQLLPWLYFHRRCNLSFRVLFKKEILLIVSSCRVLRFPPRRISLFLSFLSVTLSTRIRDKQI